MVYRFVVLSDEDEAFVREFEFLESHTLLDFHNAIQEELEFDKSQIASFYMATDSWEKEEEFTLFDMGAGSSTMENAVLEEVIFRKNQKLLYVFDFFNDRALFIEYVGESKED
ncbi:MAG: plasmid pRiA4b ORF-3 family protein [Marinilabiliales bacterium]|nr:plasmid pRiA4b ORF-3 family protein [Marinilabiliales bacterium]